MTPDVGTTVLREKVSATGNAKDWLGLARVLLRQGLDLRRLVLLAARRPDRALGGAEQVLTSIFSMIGLIGLSRLLDLEAFGTIGAAISIALVVQLIHDSITVAPLVIACPEPRHDRAAFGEWLLWHFLVMGILVGGLLALGLLVGHAQPVFGHELVLAAPILLGSALFSFSRRMHYHWATFRALLLQTALYGAIYACGMVGLWATEALTPETAALMLALALGIPGFLYTIRDCREAHFSWSLLSHVSDSRRLIASMGAAGVVWQSSYASALISLSLLSTPVAVAVFTVTRTLERPIALVISTVLDVDTSRASRAFPVRGIDGLTEVVTGARWILVGVTAVPIALVMAFPGFLLTMVYGEPYAGATLELQLRILVLVPLVLTAPLYLGLTVLRDTAYLLWVTVLGCLVGVAFLLACHLLDQLNAATANASLVLMQLTAVPFLLLRYAAKVRAAKEEQK